jgi:hypothetical protein
MSVESEDWMNAAARAGNLSQLELSLGEVALAAADAEQSVTYAERSGDAFQRLSKRVIHADALHHAGRPDEAEVRFREAEDMQAGNQPRYPHLYAFQGFLYCGLLLAAAERAAWRHLLNLSCVPQPASLLKSCRAVSKRVEQTIKIAESNNWLLDIALDHLTVGRAALYAAILDGLALAILAANPSSTPWTVSAALGCNITFPVDSSPAPGCAVSPARAPAPRARKATSTKL